MTEPRSEPAVEAGSEGADDVRAPVPESGGGAERQRSLWGDAWYELYHNPVFVFASILVLAIISMAAFPGLWTSVDPRACELGEARQPPGDGHIFGTTVFGCDMYASVVYGARPSIIIAVVVTSVTTVLGTAIGTVAAYYGRWVDAVLSRITDIAFGLPFILGALVVLLLVESHSVWAISLALIVLGWSQMMRIMRGSVLATKESDFIVATRALGASDVHIIVRHILPNAMAPAVVLATLYLGGYVSAEATLTFLGVGLQQPEVSWGILINQGQEWAVTGQWFLLIFPCGFLIITVLSFILLGDVLRDALDPKLR